MAMAMPTGLLGAAGSGRGAGQQSVGAIVNDPASLEMVYALEKRRFAPRSTEFSADSASMSPSQYISVERSSPMTTISSPTSSALPPMLLQPTLALISPPPSEKDPAPT